MKFRKCEQELCAHYDDCAYDYNMTACLHALDVNAEPFVDTPVTRPRRRTDENDPKVGKA